MIKINQKMIKNNKKIIYYKQLIKIILNKI